MQCSLGCVCLLQDARKSRSQGLDTKCFAVVGVDVGVGVEEIECLLSSCPRTYSSLLVDFQVSRPNVDRTCVR